MGISIPYVDGMLHERTRDWWKAPRTSNDQLVWTVTLDATDDVAYWRWLVEEWTVTEPDAFERYTVPVTPDLLIVEQDMVPAPGVVDRMLDCPRPWCSSPYRIGSGIWLDEGLGCTKFAVRLKTRHPDLMQRVGDLDDDGQPAKTWRRLDTRIARLLRDLGYAPHRHARSEHLHDYARRP